DAGSEGRLAARRRDRPGGRGRRAPPDGRDDTKGKTDEHRVSLGLPAEAPPQGRERKRRPLGRRRDPV
ncbi:MAG: hypothetical protein AVDCRST_MAG03-2171, partial [uncultured Rubrobacteraceae bacterium]